MKIYIGNQGTPYKRKIIENHPLLGQMITAGNLGLIRMQGTYALDNGAFGCFVNDRPFDDLTFLKSVDQLKDFPKPDFVVLPDKMTQGKKSLEYSMVWRKFLPDEYPYYLVVQDGIYPKHITPEVISQIAGLFIGGSLDWKLKTGEEWVEFGHSVGLKVHIGRAGTESRLNWAKKIGADSIDSTNFSQTKNSWEMLMDWLDSPQSRLL